MARHRCEKKTVKLLLKKTVLAAFAGLLLAGLFVFAACSNLGGDYDGHDSGAQTVGGQPIALDGAQNANSLVALVSIPNLPALGSNKPADGVAKSAFPGVDQLSDTKFVFGATLEGAGGTTYTADGNYDSSTGKCSFAFANAYSDQDQNYTLTINLYYVDSSVTPATKNLVASGSQEISVAANASSFGADVQLFPNADSTINGSLKLPVKLADAGTGASVSVMLLKGEDDVTSLYILSSTVNLDATTGQGEIKSAASGIPAGTYTLLLTFKQDSSQVGSRVETLNIYPGLETSVWWTNDAAGATPTLNVSKYDQKEFWVRGEGGEFYSHEYASGWTAADTNSGSFAAPFATVQAAVNKINKVGDATSQYTVYIDGKVTGDSAAYYGSEDNKAFINVTGASKILFKGWTGPDKDIIDVNKRGVSGVTRSGRAFAIVTTAKITLQDLSITKGKGDTSSNAIYGGAILVGDNSASSPVLADVKIVNVNISDCSAPWAGAIYVTGGSVELKNSVVTGCSATTRGGGICVSGSSAAKASLTIEDSEISNNQVTNASNAYGGGLNVINNSEAIFKSGLIGSDEAGKGNSAYYGGGVSVNQGGIFSMSGTARISGNSAKVGTTETYGGGLYADSSCSMSGQSQISNNTAKNGGGVCVTLNGLFCMSGSAVVGKSDVSAPASSSTAGYRSNYASSYGGGIYAALPSKVKLGYAADGTTPATFDGGVYYNYASSGGGIDADSDVSDKTLFIDAGNICFNGCSANGGGVSASVVKMTGGNVSNNTTAMTGSGNGYGGGIYATTVCVGGGQVAGNKAKSGGGVYAIGHFYLYGSGVIGDRSVDAVATGQNDCSNYASVYGGGVYSAGQAYIGYCLDDSDSITQAECTGGIYRNFATGLSSGTYVKFGAGGGLYMQFSSNTYPFVFKMDSGTVAYNAVTNSNNYGGGINLCNKTDPSTQEITGGSIIGNSAKIGGGVYAYLQNSLKVGGGIYAPSATGKQGDNDICLLDEDRTLEKSSAFTDTHNPVMTVTPPLNISSLAPKYAAGTAIFDSSIGDECSKIEVAKVSGASWAIDTDGTLKTTTRLVYIASPTSVPSGVTKGSDEYGNGTISAPYASIDKAVHAFTDPKAAPLDRPGDLPEFPNKIYVLSDMTYGSGVSASQAAYFEIVGYRGKSAGASAQFTLNTSDPTSSGFYIQHGQKVKFININFTQTASEPNAYAAIVVPPAKPGEGKLAGEAFLDNCSITGITATKCSAISAEGDVHLKNVSIKNNIAVATSEGFYEWGPAVFSKQGKISLLGKVEICDNKMDVSDGAGTAFKPQNVWIGDNKDVSGDVYFEPLVIAGALTAGSNISVTTYDPSATVFTSGWSTYNPDTDPADVFDSDTGLSVYKNAGGEVALKKPTDLYVSSSTSDPAGDDDLGTGSAKKPLASVARAMGVINDLNDSTVDYTIHVAGTLTENVNIPNSLAAAKIAIAGSDATMDKLDGVDYTDSVVSVATTIPVELSNLTITRGTHGVMVDSTGNSLVKPQVTISNCVIDDNKSAGDGAHKQGAGIYADMYAGANRAASGTLTVTDTTISNNVAATKGGGIYIHAGNLSCVDCQFLSNTALDGAGGGICGDNDSSIKLFNIEGGKICHNKAYKASSGEGNGAGLNVATQSGADPLVKGVEISENVAVGNGGGIQITTGKYLTIQDCQIKSNEANKGAGVYAGGRVTIKGGTISGNTATLEGGGVSSSTSSATLSISGAEISGNTAASGGGVYSTNGFTIGGAVSIPAGTDGKNDVWLKNGQTIDINAPLTAASTPVATITPESYELGTAVVKATATTVTLADELAKFAVTPYSGADWSVVANAAGDAGVLRSDNVSSGGISISISEGVKFVVTAPKKSGQAASFAVQDASGAPLAATLPHIEIKKKSSTVYSADAQSVDAPYLSAGNYQLYCRATVDGSVFDTTVEFTVAASGGGSVPEGFVTVTGATVIGPLSVMSVFVSGRTVKIPELYVCDHEVTQKEWYDVMGVSQSEIFAFDRGLGDNYPVYNVNWYHAIAYCNKRSLAEDLEPCYTVTSVTDWKNLAFASIPTSNDDNWNKVTCDWSANGYRLPTEAEWEYIAFNKNKDSYTYAGSGNIDEVAWYTTNAGNKTHEVKTAKLAGKDSANGLGIYDMSGNVWEWCWDWFGSLTTSTDAHGPSSGEKRVRRGGSWDDTPINCEVSYRDYEYPYNRNRVYGFRVVRNAE
ncbi:MAG: SUMF1/EgtB/PvdO family nonheme iron enzyme [Treponema sp.]|nr:SUMF1/EgtB/PvdO family nonheme iron enzyme [Treponema sp.]